MRPRKSTRIWLAVFVGLAADARLLAGPRDSRRPAVSPDAVALAAGLVLVWRARRLPSGPSSAASLRLAFSYFLIGLVPIPLLADVALSRPPTSSRTSSSPTGSAARSPPSVRKRRSPRRPASARRSLFRGGRTAFEPLLAHRGGGALVARTSQRPGFVVRRTGTLAGGPPRSGDRASCSTSRTRELPGYSGWPTHRVRGGALVGKVVGRGWLLGSRPAARTSPGDRQPAGTDRGLAHPPASRRAGGDGIWRWRGEWIHAFYVETLTNAAETEKQTGRNTAMVSARTSPRMVTDQLFSQGVAGIAGVFWCDPRRNRPLLLAVYLVALAIAFMLGGSIVRNVNKLTRAAQAVCSRGLLGPRSTPVQGSDRRPGPLVRRHGRLRSRASSSRRPARSGSRARSRWRARSRQAAPARARRSSPGSPSWRTSNRSRRSAGTTTIHADARRPRPPSRSETSSGHGLPTGLLVAMAKAALATLLEAGHRGRRALRSPQRNDLSGRRIRATS